MRVLKNKEYPLGEVLGHILNEIGCKCSELYKNSTIK
jgi:hypothetical protein